MFIKRSPNAIQQFDTELCPLEQHTSKYDGPPHPTVTENVKTTLVKQGQSFRQDILVRMIVFHLNRELFLFLLHQFSPSFFNEIYYVNSTFIL